MKTALLLAAMVLASGAADAQVVRQVTDSHLSEFFLPRVTADGSAAFVISSGDLTGENPEGRARLFRVDLVSGATTQLAGPLFGVVAGSFGLHPPGIAGDGSRVAFVSGEDLTGQNSDRSHEIFLMDVDGSNLTQVTDATGDVGSIGHIELTPDGTRFVFSASFDYLGTNPGHESRIWVIDADTTGLTQLSGGPGYWPSISADGQRVVFTGSAGIEAVEADGSNLRQLTTWYSFGARISADGSTVSFLGTGTLPNQSPGWCNDGTQIGAIDWDGGNPIKLSGLCLGASYPGDVFWGDLAADGQQIYYVGRDLFGVVRKVDRNATTETVLAPPSGGDCSRIGVAAGGSRVVALCSGDLAGTNPDGNAELYAIEADGSAVVQRTFTPDSGDSETPSIAHDTGAIVFASDANLLRELPVPGKELYRVNADGSGLERVTSFAFDEPETPETSADGSLTVFTVDDAFTEQHHLHTVSSPGNVVTPIAVGLSFFAPAISADGSRIVAVNGSNGNIYSMGPDGSGLAPVATGSYPRLDGSGSTMVFSRAFSEVWSVEFPGGAELFLATGDSPDISRDGQRIAFQSDADPFGANPDRNIEIFVVRPDGSQLLQLTISEGFDNVEPAISGDGQFVYYAIEIDGSRDLYRVQTLTRQTERVGGLGCALPLGRRPMDVDQTGTLAVFAGGANCSGENADGNDEIYVIDRGATPVLRIGPDQPTVVRWDAHSGPTQYDVVRGDGAGLASGGDLGTVFCVENDSLDNSTLGFPDPVEPNSGELFFYLVRALPGGDYGTDSSGTPRVASAGDCAN